MTAAIVPPDFDKLGDDNQVQSFTSWKLDLQNAMLIDPRLNSTDFRVACCILQFMNGVTGQCNPAQETIAELINVSLRTVEYAVKHLEAAGWLKARKTKMTNWYEFLDTHVSAMSDRRTSIDDARRERRNENKTRKQLRVAPPATRNDLRLQTRNDLRLQTRNQLRLNTLLEHPIGSPESDSALDRGGTRRNEVLR